MDTATAKASTFTLGKPITIVTALGKQKLTLVGLTKFGDADSAGGVISIGTTLHQAQLVTGEPDRIDEVDVRAKPGVSPDQLVQRLETAKVTPKADVLTGRQAASEQANEVKSAFGFFSKILQVFALIALFVGAFIISNTFSILVAQRTRELALLRAIGGSRGQVLGSVLLEAVVVGLISAVLGFATGVGLAVGALALLKAAGLDLPTAGVTITPLSLAYAIGLGVLITLVAALLPARRATLDLVYGAPYAVARRPWPRTHALVAETSAALHARMRDDLAAGLALTGQRLPGPIPAESAKEMT